MLWEDISVDFIIELPKSGGIDTIFVVANRFSKYIHLGLYHPFTAKSVAALFSQEVVWLHGIHASIISDWDTVLLSIF